jgi:hypothetical protein
MEVRLKKRADELVKESMKIAENAVKGITTTLKESNLSMSAIQAAWRFYNNGRVNIESYFKLLKTTGFNLEKWQQEKPLALFKRLIVVAYAVVLVFKLANSDDENAKKRVFSQA